MGFFGENLTMLSWKCCKLSFGIKFPNECGYDYYKLDVEHNKIKKPEKLNTFQPC
jgi:hypothetical protein